MEELRTLKGSLEERIGEERTAIHRDALQAFLADDAVDKAAYDAALEKALGDDTIARAMHNALLLATLRHALADAGSEMDVDEAHAPADNAVAPSHNPPLQTTAAAAEAAPAAAASALPTLSLRIKRDSATGGFAAVGTSSGVGAVEAVPTVVDPEEASQLHALNDRVLQIATSLGVEAVDPAAVAFMQRALRAFARRSIIAGWQQQKRRSIEAPTVSAQARPSEFVRHMVDAALSSSSASGLVPPNQRFATHVRNSVHSAALL